MTDQKPKTKRWVGALYSVCEFCGKAKTCNMASVGANMPYQITQCNGFVRKEKSDGQD